MLLPDLKKYIDTIKPHAREITDAQLRDALAKSGWPPDSIQEAVDYLRSPAVPASTPTGVSLPPTTPSPTTESAPIAQSGGLSVPKIQTMQSQAVQPSQKTVVIPKSVVEQMTSGPKEADATTDRYPSFMQWIGLTSLSVVIGLGVIIGVFQTMDDVISNTKELLTVHPLSDTTTLLALSPAILISLLGVVLANILGRMAYRRKGRVILSFLYGSAVHFLYTVFASVVLLFVLPYISKPPSDDALALSLAFSLAESVYIVIFIGGFIVGVVFHFLSFMRPVPLSASFLERGTSQWAVVIAAILVAFYIFDGAYFPAILTKQDSLCMFIRTEELRADCLDMIRQ